jgi:aspartyl-tRNA(Asn)/glutamyl-tRNA(Gln) amidotransferase subunit A
MNLPWTQSGLPALNLPAGENKAGLPLGLQLIGKWYQDDTLLMWAKDMEAELLVKVGGLTPDHIKT